MSLFVKVENDTVVSVWDTQPPAHETGWRPAIEVNVPHFGRQGKHGHSFDLTKDPVEIVYDTYDISVEERKASLIHNATARADQMQNTAQLHPELISAEQVQAAALFRDQFIARINEAFDHNQLDVLDMEMAQTVI